MVILMANNDNVMKTGTTTVGLIGKDVIVLAADKRATAGNFIAGKNMQKVKEIGSYMGVTTAGAVSTIQLMVKLLQAELQLKDIRTDRNSTVKEAANLLAGMTLSTPGVSHFLLGGYDVNGPDLYEIYADGSLTDVKSEGGFIASGSGSMFVYGLLEDKYKPDLSEKETVDLAISAVQTAVKRDSASGQGVDVLVIGKEGIKDKFSLKMDSNFQ